MLRAFVRDGYAHLAMLLGLGALVAVCLLGLPFALVLMGFPAAVRIPMGRKLISRSMAAYLYFLKIFCYVRIDASALEPVRLDRPLIIIANHPSLLDAVILQARTCGPTSR